MDGGWRRLLFMLLTKIQKRWLRHICCYHNTEICCLLYSRKERQRLFNHRNISSIERHILMRDDRYERVLDLLQSSNQNPKDFDLVDSTQMEWPTFQDMVLILDMAKKAFGCTSIMWVLDHAKRQINGSSNTSRRSFILFAKPPVVVCLVLKILS